jgi:hypothetical protein
MGNDLPRPMTQDVRVLSEWRRRRREAANSTLTGNLLAGAVPEEPGDHFGGEVYRAARNGVRRCSTPQQLIAFRRSEGADREQVPTAKLAAFFRPHGRLAWFRR